MARIEEDKEDLMVDATALVHRAEFVRTDDEGAPHTWHIVTIGFRKDDSLSVYFDQDPFYQFDASGLLRRALEDSLLLRSQTDTLAKLHRARSDASTTLLREDLSPEQLEAFRQRMRTYVEELVALLADGKLDRRRVVSDDNALNQRVVEALRQVLSQKDPFLSKAIRQRR
ncbi:hypothetical protein [Fuerstiella marisgermanici]|uniref:Uncharacterized protein n=1 Tax=Fuerstiella marisgermanici TaxID=1891926 RepID=A0A1P8WFI9_9PLAN|nr:hypothetical protein [Fuerstiella marisgermanici]APZ92811.1 hypothetical protein Fuma_02423 [Fuerstiella marisgermanici]